MVRKQWIKKQTISVKPVAVPVEAKPVVKPTVAKTKSDRNTPIHPSNTIEAKNEQIAVLEAQLAALKSLNVSTSEKKVS